MSSLVLGDESGTKRCIGQQAVVDIFNLSQAKLEAANKKCQLIQSKLEAIERLLSNPATQYYMSLNGKMLVTKMREILKGAEK